MAPNNRSQPGHLDFVKLGHPTNLLCKNQPDRVAGVYHAYPQTTLDFLGLLAV